MKNLRSIANMLFRQDKEHQGQREPHSAEFLRRRRFFLVMPLLVLPFMTLMFWALGGGQANSSGNPSQPHKGLNLQLPDASLKADKLLDKLGYYEKAAADSARLKGLMMNDPNYNRHAPPGSFNPDSLIEGRNFDGRFTPIGSNLNGSPNAGYAFQDPNEAKVYEKLEQLNRALNQGSHNAGALASGEPAFPPGGNSGLNATDLEQLQLMMQVTGQNEAEDPEMQQLDGMLEKILDIQHPKRVQEKLRQNLKANKGKVFPVSEKGKTDPVSLLATGGSGKGKKKSRSDALRQRNDFFSWQEDKGPSDPFPSAIAAVVHETQSVVAGSTVKLRLTTAVTINGTLVPKDSFLFGTASLNGERIIIKINIIRFQNSLFPVDLSVYDLDGLPGIYIPGAITRDVARQSADRAVHDIGISAIDPSREMEAASTGIEVAKSLFSKKAKLVKVTVKAGYQVLLRDEKQM